MKKKKIRPRDIKRFEEHLYSEEKSKATIEKYIRDIKKFSVFLGDNYSGRTADQQGGNYRLQGTSDGGIFSGQRQFHDSLSQLLFQV